MTFAATHGDFSSGVIPLGKFTSMADVSPLDDFSLDAQPLKRQGLSGFARGFSTHRASQFYAESLFGAAELAPTVGRNDSKPSLIVDNASVKARDEVLKDLRLLRGRPKAGSLDQQLVLNASIDDAIVVAQGWPRDLTPPCVDVDEEGLISLEIICENGLAIGAIDFLGVNHVAAFSIIDGSRIVGAGKLNTASTTEVIQFFQKFNDLVV